MNVISFLKCIENDFISLIMRYAPGKCHTVSNILASYMTVHFNHLFKHISSGSHGWVISDDLSIDFANLECGPIFTPESEAFLFYRAGRPDTRVVDLLALDLANFVTNPYEVTSFLKFFEENFPIADKRVQDRGYYTRYFGSNPIVK